MTILLLTAAAPAVAQGLSVTDPALQAQGWRVAPAIAASGLSFRADGETGLVVQGRGGAGLIYQPVRVPVHPELCLAWRWRVDAGPAAPDRAIAVWIGFEADGERMTLLQRYSLGLARMMSRTRIIPGFLLMYAWGGPSEDVAWQATPLLPGLGRGRTLRPASQRHAAWVEEEVRLAADFRAAFAIAPTGYVTELAISADADDTGAAIDARIEGLGFRTCRPAARQTVR